MAPYAVKGGIVRTADAVGEVMLKGVDTAYDWSAFRGWLVDGGFAPCGGFDPHEGHPAFAQPG